MNRTTLVGLWAMAAALLISCGEPERGMSSVDPVNWARRSARIGPSDSLETGASYLSVYSEIYSQTEHLTHNLTATISMRNTSRTDTLYIAKAEFFNTSGESIRNYFDHPIFIAPLETVEIVIDEHDQEGGTGGNFLFDWQVAPGADPPLFEAIMISTSGQQGLSFSTRGVPIKQP